MKMRDKEFDKVFKDKLFDLEVEPSDSVWAGVESKVSRGGSPKSWLPLIGIAASTLLVISFGLAFLIKQGNQSGSQVVHLTHHKKEDKLTATAALPVNARLMAQQIMPEPVKKAGGRLQVVKHYIKPMRINTDVATADTERSAQLSATVPLASNGAARAGIGRMAATERFEPARIDVTSAARVNINTGIQPNDSLPLLSIKRIAKHGSRRKVITLGDMFNAVIAKVDKRKDKIIEFENTDGDESSITAVNLGIIRIKKEI
jgi:hypothetical protein